MKNRAEGGAENKRAHMWSIHESFIPNKHIHMSAINTIILYTFSWEIKKCWRLEMQQQPRFGHNLHAKFNIESNLNPEYKKL